MRDRIFAIVDADDNGKISTQEITTFIENWQPEMTNCERMLYVIKISVTNWSWILSVIFFFGGALSFMNHIAKRVGADGLWTHDTIPVGMVTAYCYTIGCLMFANERFKFESNKYEMEELVRGMVKVFIAKLDNEEKNHTESNDVEAFHDHENIKFDQTRFNTFLEDNGIYMPKFQVETLFRHNIDDGGDDGITKGNLTIFLNVKRNKMLTIAKRCSTCLVFLSNFVWIIGSVAYVIASHTKYATVADINYKVSTSSCLNVDDCTSLL